MVCKQKGRYVARWRDRSRKQRAKVFPKGTPKATADMFERDMKIKVASGGMIQNSVTFKDLAERWIKEYSEIHKTESSVIKDHSTLKHHLLPEFGKQCVTSIDPSAVSQFQQALCHKRNLAPQSVNNIVGLLSSILRYGVNTGLIKFNPCGSIRRIKRQERTPTFWTLEEMQRFLGVCRGEDYELFQMCAFALNTGLRPGELRALKRDCINFELRYVEVRRNFCTKTGRINEYTKNKRVRRVPLNHLVLDLIANKRSLASDALIFPWLTNSIGFFRLQPMARKAGVKPIRFHDLRHTFASHLVLHKKNPVEIKELLGHTKLETTDKYMHLMEGWHQGATDCLAVGFDWRNNDRAKVVNFPARKT